jgi:hypothetical protein
MSRLPVPRGSGESMMPTRLELAAPVHGEPTVGELWGILRRNWWIILGCTVVSTAVAAWVTLRTIPLYRSSIAIRINEKQSPVPQVLLPLSNGSEVSTEMCPRASASCPRACWGCPFQASGRCMGVA